MSPLLQWLIVLPLVVGATLFAAWRLMTARLRLRVLSGLLQCLPKREHGALAHLRSAIARKASEAASGCAACSKH
jgi:hypothetical protein